MLSFLKVTRLSSTVPSASTVFMVVADIKGKYKKTPIFDHHSCQLFPVLSTLTSKPRTVPWSEPYRKYLSPPALVEMLPPI